MARHQGSPASIPTLSRSLLAPGPQPPLSHLGATLMRHVVGTVVRYSLYQLGLPMPDAPPVRILRLRVLLDAAPLEAALGVDAVGAEIRAALLQPGGSGELPSSAGRLRAAAALHRARLATLGPRRGRAGAGETTAAGAPSGLVDAASSTGSAAAEAAGARSGRTREELWRAVCATVAGRMPYLCDAGLGEVVTALARRRRRLGGQDVPPALGQVAWQIHQGRASDLGALGALDPFHPSWKEAAVPNDDLRRRAELARGTRPLPARSGRRGAFREAYRWVLSEVRPLLCELGAAARDQGVVDHPDDVFFVPFDLGAELAAAHRPSWLAAAVATNRREHDALRREPEHADEIFAAAPLAPLEDRSTLWERSPLAPVE
jgi:hypothetical protein